MDTMICNKCGLQKDINEFELRSDTHKRRNTCKECRKKYLKVWHEDNKEYIKEYREKNKKRIQQKSREYYELNKEKLITYSKEFRDSHKEYYSDYNKRYKSENKDYISEYNKKYLQVNHDSIMSRRKQYYEDNVIETIVNTSVEKVMFYGNENAIIAIKVNDYDLFKKKLNIYNGTKTLLHEFEEYDINKLFVNVGYDFKNINTSDDYQSLVKTKKMTKNMR